MAGPEAKTEAFDRKAHRKFLESVQRKTLK